MARQYRQVEPLARIFRILGDPTRLRILMLLSDGPRNVSDLCKRLKMPQPTVSHHLGLLRMGELVDTRRNGKQVFYSLRNSLPDRAGRALRSMLRGADTVRIGPLAVGTVGS